jgi:hypothetical protein
MKGIFKIVLWSFGIMLLIGALGFVGKGMGLISYSFFEPKMEDARRDVFENTNAFVKGKLSDTNRDMFEYRSNSDPLVKNALKYKISQNLVDFDEDKYCKSVELKSFIKQMKYGTPLPIPSESPY